MHRAGPWTSQIFLPQHRTFCPNEEKASTVHASCKTLGCMGSMLANIVRLVSSCGHGQTRQFWHRVPWGRRVLLHETSLYFILAGRSWFTGGCQSHSLANGFSRIRTMAPRKESQRLIHYANPLQPVKHHTLWISQALSRSCSPPSCKGRVFGRRRIAEAVRGRWHLPSQSLSTAWSIWGLPTRITLYGCPLPRLPKGGVFRGFSYHLWQAVTVSVKLE